VERRRQRQMCIRDRERTARGDQFIWPDAFVPARERNYGQATIYYANYQP
jgi:16S rRNA (guanine966-N2)-methyltransferase